MKYILLTIIMLSAYLAQGAVGIFQTYINYNIGAIGNYRAGTFNADGAPTFDGFDLGTLTSFTLNGGEVKSWKNSGGDVTGAQMYYRIYDTATVGGVFTELTLPFGADLGGGDQRWDETAAGINLLNCLAPGRYYLEVYWRITTNEGDVYDSNSGLNHRTKFTVVGAATSNGTGNWSNPTTWSSLPNNNDLIEILENDTVYVDMDDTIAGIVNHGTIIFNGSETLTILTSPTGCGAAYGFVNHGELDAANGTIIFDGNATVSGTLSFHNVTMKGTVDFGGMATVLDTFTICSGNVNINPPLYGPASTLNYATGDPTGAPYGRYLEWDGTAVPHNVVFTNGTYVDIPNGAPNVDRPLTGDFVLDSGGIFMYDMDHSIIADGNVIIRKEGRLYQGTIVGGDIYVKKDLILEEGGVYFANNRMVLFNGSDYQRIRVIGNTSFTGSNKFSFLDIEHTGPGVLVETEIEVEDDVRFRGGQFILTDHNFTFTETGFVDITDVPSDGSNIVTTGSGEVRKIYSTLGAFTFPLGDSTGTKEYSPVTVDLNSGTFGAGHYMAAQVFNSKHVNNPNNTHYLNRYWVVHENNISGFDYDIQCLYKDADLIGTETLMREIKSDDGGASWTDLGAINDAANLIDAFGLTNFSIFTAGANVVLPLDNGVKASLQQADLESKINAFVTEQQLHFYANQLEEGPIKLQLFDVAGRLIYQEENYLEQSHYETVIPLAMYAEQVLLLNVKTANRNWSKKLKN